MDDASSTRLTYAVDLPGGQGRLKEAALYVMKGCAGARSFGLVKLNKTLWRADFQAYAERRVPVTGRQYQRLAQGPAPVEMPVVLSQLLREGLAELERRLVIDFEERRPIALVEPSLRYFSQDDIRYLDEAIRFYANSTGRKASEHSHGVAWRTRADGDPMPYDLAILSEEKLDKPRAQQLAALGAQRGWRTA